MTIAQTAACGLWVACAFEAYTTAGWAGVALVVAIGAVALWKLFSKKEKAHDA